MKEEIRDLINTQYEYVGNDVNPNGNEMMLFKGKDGKTYSVEVYEVG